jgi:hypothetical protein
MFLNHLNTSVLTLFAPLNDDGKNVPAVFFVLDILDILLPGEGFISILYV